MASLRTVRVHIIEQVSVTRLSSRCSREQSCEQPVDPHLLSSNVAIGVLILYSRETGGFVGCEAGATAFAQAAAILLTQGP
jgi:hypothetical protein